MRAGKRKEQFDQRFHHFVAVLMSRHFLSVTKIITVLSRNKFLLLVLFGTVSFSPISNPYKFIILYRYTLHKTLFKIFKSTRHSINYNRWYLHCKGKPSSHNINYIQIDLKADLVFSFTNQNQLIYLQIHIIFFFFLFVCP